MSRLGAGKGILKGQLQSTVPIRIWKDTRACPSSKGYLNGASGQRPGSQLQGPGTAAVLLGNVQSRICTQGPHLDKWKCFSLCKMQRTLGFCEDYVKLHRFRTVPAPVSAK